MMFNERIDWDSLAESEREARRLALEREQAIEEGVLDEDGNDVDPGDCGHVPRHRGCYHE